MAADSGQDGHSGHSAQSGRQGADGPDPWAPPEQQDRFTKRPEGVADQPTVTSMPGGAPGASPHGSPVGPPPPAPEGPQPAAAYGSDAPGHGPGYGAGGPHHGPGPGYGGYGYGGGYGGGYDGAYGQPGFAWGRTPLPQGTAVASMVLGIVGLVLTSTCWGAFLGVFVAPVALALGVSGRRKADRGEGGGRNYATSGFVMGIVGTVLSAVVVVLLIFFIANAEDFDSGPASDPGYYDALRTPAATAVTGR